MTNRSPNPNLKNYQNEKINLIVNSFKYLYVNQPKGNPKKAKRLKKNIVGKCVRAYAVLIMRLLYIIYKLI